jgi:hypothetical protein
VPGLSAHGTIDNLQLVFPELGRAAECPRECSKQKAAVPGTNQANSSPGKCFEQEAAIAATIRASPDPGECTEQKSHRRRQQTRQSLIKLRGQNTRPQNSTVSPLLGVKRTLRKPSRMSASDPTRKSGIEICCRAKVQQHINAPRIQAPKRISRSLESIFAGVYPQDYK